MTGCTRFPARRPSLAAIAAGAALVGSAPSLLAQHSIQELQDLVGARGSSGESELQARGYAYVRGSKSGSASWTFWQKGDAQHCISVRTEEGRYRAIVHAAAADCAPEDGAANGGGGHDMSSGDLFETVCGVIVDQKRYRYRCRAVDAVLDGRTVRTVLHYPDQKIALVWKPGNRVEVRFEGMNPQDVGYVRSEAETSFIAEGKTYFYIPDRDAARMEVESFQP